MTLNALDQNRPKCDQFMMITNVNAINASQRKCCIAA